MQITPCIFKVPKNGSWVKYCRTPKCIIALRTRKPRKPRAPLHPCFPTQDLSAQPAYQGQFRGLARDWKSGVGHSDDPFPLHAVNIDKAAWNAFAFAHPYATNTFPVRCGAIRLPWDYRKRTGYQLFQAWNQAALSARFYRKQFSHIWNPKFPYTLWPSPPASYVPRFVTDLVLDTASFPPFIAPFIIGPPNTDHFYWVLSASRPARKSPGTGRHALEHLRGDEWIPNPAFPVQATDNASYKARWHCKGDGYVDVAVYLVDFATGSPGPTFTKTFKLIY